MFLRMKSKVLLVLLVILSTWDWEFFTEYQTYHSDIFIGAVIVFFFFFNFFLSNIAMYCVTLFEYKLPLTN